MRDVVIALISGGASVVLKIMKGRLSLALSKQNALEAIFPVLVFAAVLGSIEIVRAAQKLMADVASETLEIKTDSGLLDPQGATIFKPVGTVLRFIELRSFQWLCSSLFAYPGLRAYLEALSASSSSRPCRIRECNLRKRFFGPDSGSVTPPSPLPSPTAGVHLPTRKANDFGALREKIYL